ncbi:PREDICTED: gamma-interferon-inducible lysosomal thiol reductase-like [Papilio polytes]|uniref:gamma-interferon-inducible lysosomal thiol reductase-like n=1 Tax=Papilio polytes TaxID=76194 RepID=UPI0006767170|nr:PREDICTED: gamma-interferon-inducible lysosomal thiol reductase-like [Papilio polytes]
MVFYPCTRYRLVVLLMLILIMWQIMRLIPTEKSSPQLTGSDIIALEDGNYNKHKQDKVKVRVYYEALCPDSKHFFIKHLWPVTEKLSEFLNVALVPYGKASTKEENGKYYFMCQHGEEECYANTIHSCSIDILGNMTLSVKFTECMIMDNMDADKALERCSQQMNVDPEPINRCASSEHGAALLKKHGDDTDIIKPTFIPTITLNGSRGNQGAILKNFLLEVCKLIDMPLPPPCL